MHTGMQQMFSKLLHMYLQMSGTEKSNCAHSMSISRISVRRADSDKYLPLATEKRRRRRRILRRMLSKLLPNFIIITGKIGEYG